AAAAAAATTTADVAAEDDVETAAAAAAIAVTGGTTADNDHPMSALDTAADEQTQDQQQQSSRTENAGTNVRSKRIQARDALRNAALLAGAATLAARRRIASHEIDDLDRLLREFGRTTATLYARQREHQPPSQWRN
ncbi:unnamed protein product, partial [Tilletia controversa]